MADPITCSKHPIIPYKSEADTLSARAGNTRLLLNGKPPATYVAGSTNRITIVSSPASTADAPPSHPSTEIAHDLQRAAAASSFFLLDAGVGTFSKVTDGGAQGFHLQCDGTRVAFNGPQGVPVEVDWTAPPAGHQSVSLRVAAATSMGNVTVNAAVLNASSSKPSPDEDTYVCSISEQATSQCVRVPKGTQGATNEKDCAAQCKPYRCQKCKHVYFPDEDGNGAAFEDLPDSWKCPMCGAPKSAYTKQVVDGGSVKWSVALV